jgi:type II secretory pathway component PulM
MTENQEALAQRWAKLIISVQSKLAAYLNQQTAGFGQRKWLWLLGLMCLLIGAYCSFLLLKALIDFNL